MKNLTCILLVVVSAFVLSSCTGNAVYMKNTRTFAATDPKSVQLYASTSPSVGFEVIGYVSTYTTYADHDGDLLKDNLKIQAAKVGANAIIGFKLNIAETGGGGAQGVAIRFLN
jgi:uncharacterized protein YbjQ (UPF0145 family)